MECIVEIKSNEVEKKRYTTMLRTDTLEKLEIAKIYLRNSNPKISKWEIIDLALNNYFDDLNIKECVLEEIIPVVVKRTGYEVVE